MHQIPIPHLKKIIIFPQQPSWLIMAPKLARNSSSQMSFRLDHQLEHFLNCNTCSASITKLSGWAEMEKICTPRVLSFYSCANLCFFSRLLLKVFGLLFAILGIFANFARFWAFFAHILCPNF